MSIENNNEIKVNANIEPIIYQLINEFYTEFKLMHGAKHLKHVKEVLEDIATKIKLVNDYGADYNGVTFAGHDDVHEIKCNYSNKLSAVLKHELWHVFNRLGMASDLSLLYIPQRYKEHLEKNGFIRMEYSKIEQSFKENTGRSYPINYETFLEGFSWDYYESEKWTEWFATKTHPNDMKDYFSEFQDGFFIMAHSSGSSYDYFLNIADMISCLIPRDKLLDMVLYSDDYITSCSYAQMIDEFDEKYTEALTESEKEEYGYPYLKILMDTKHISENSRNNSTLARECFQSCMSTCFRAYLQKIQEIQDVDLDTAREIYREIKYMQKHMIWNIDVSRMEKLEYVQIMKIIQNKFVNMVQGLAANNLEVRQMIDNVDYLVGTPFIFIQNGEEIAEKMLECYRKKTKFFDGSKWIQSFC